MICCDMHGTSYSHCARCHATFLAVTDFDHHQDVDYQRHPPVLCLIPAALGMVTNDAGIWGTPEGHARRGQDSARMARMHRSRRGGFAQTAERAAGVPEPRPGLPGAAETGDGP